MAEPELDTGAAEGRLRKAAEAAKRLEAEGRDVEAVAAWERYELIKQAIAAQERAAGAATRFSARRA